MEKVSRETSYLSNILNDADVRIGEIRDCIEDTDSELRDCGEPEPGKRSLVYERMCQQRCDSATIGGGVYSTLLVFLASGFSFLVGAPLKKENMAMVKCG
jgi:hypothetical protein